MGFKIKQNDTSPLMVATLKDAAGNAIDLTAATVRFHMKRISSTTVKVDGAATVLDDDAGRVRYAWQTGDTDTPGTFQGEFEVVYNTGEIETFPNDGFLAIEIIDDIA